jgi:hypothetical protein
MAPCINAGWAKLDAYYTLTEPLCRKRRGSKGWRNRGHEEEPDITENLGAARESGSRAWELGYGVMEIRRSRQLGSNTAVPNPAAYHYDATL